MGGFSLLETIWNQWYSNHLVTMLLRWFMYVITDHLHVQHEAIQVMTVLFKNYCHLVQ